MISNYHPIRQFWPVIIIFSYICPCQTRYNYVAKCTVHAIECVSVVFAPIMFQSSSVPCIYRALVTWQRSNIFSPTQKCIFQRWDASQWLLLAWRQRGLLGLGNRRPTGLQKLDPVISPAIQNPTKYQSLSYTIEKSMAVRIGTSVSIDLHPKLMSKKSLDFFQLADRLGF